MKPITKIRIAAVSTIACLAVLVGCEENPAEPIVYEDGLEWSRTAEKVFEAVNQRANEMIVVAKDMDQYGVSEYADDGRKTGAGDCEDYVIAKLAMLREFGYCRPGECLMLMVQHANMEEESYHAVLAVKTKRKILVLDNRVPQIHSWHRAGYTLSGGAIEFVTPTQKRIVDANAFGLRGEG